MQRRVKLHIQSDDMPAPSELVHSPKTSEVFDLTAKFALQEDVEGSLEPKVDSL